MRRVVRILLVAAVTATVLPHATATADPGLGRIVEADPFTGTAGPLEAGELELAVLSSRATTVTGGDALLGIRGIDDHDEIAVAVDGRDVTDAFGPGPQDGSLVGLVDGLVEGDNLVTLVADHPDHGRRGASLPLTNHPITGPVFSGPHQEPFVCRTADAGLGEPIDDDCSIEPRVQWFALSAVTQTFAELDDPYADYPADTSVTLTTDGETVPYVVRVETVTLNRGITRIAVLDDPAARGADAPYEPTDAWNRRILHQWGASCGVGYHQGTNSVDSVLTGLPDGTGSVPEGVPAAPRPPVGDGYLVAHSTLTTLGTHCNQVLSAETFAIIREHVTERYGLHDLAFGSGASGGAIQQVTTMDTYPGILDGGVPMLTFPDVVTTAMSPADCRLLLEVFEDDPETWGELERTAVSGHLTSQICRDWDELFADHLVADRGCHGSVPAELIYDADTNPDGVRCTLQDTLVNLMGIDPDTGFARRPVDNTGVQYGRAAVDDGTITVEEFVALNERIGGFDIDGNIVDERMAMDPDLAHKMYEVGAVSGRGALAESPAVFVSTYVDAVPILGFHDAIRAYQIRERLRAHAGRDDTHAIWSGVPLPNDAWPVVDRWLTDLAAARDAAGGLSDDGWADEVAATRPSNAADGCVVTGGGAVPGGALVPIGGHVGAPCEQVFRPLGSPRTVAGGPVAEDVIKCALRPLDRDLDGDGFDDGQWARMEATFPDGVCDWDRPGVGEVDRSRTWLSYGTTEVLDDPVDIANPVARTTVLAAVAPPPGGDADDGGTDGRGPDADPLDGDTTAPPTTAADDGEITPAADRRPVTASTGAPARAPLPVTGTAVPLAALAMLLAATVHRRPDER